MNRIYQAKHKNSFTNTSNNKETYDWIFDKTFDYEVKYSKDLFDFDKDQLLDFFSSRKMQLQTMKNYISYISSYINWAIKNSLKLSDKNAALEIKDKEIKKIAKKEDDVFHVDTIYEIAGIKEPESFLELNNKQDQLLIYLIFLGVRGEKGSELINLQTKHIDKENKLIKLSELDPYRTDIPIDQYCLDLIDDTMKEVHYNRYMDEFNPDKVHLNTKENYDIDESTFLFRKSKVGKHSGEDQITYQALMRRIRSISSFTGEKLNMNRIEKSGMVYVGKMLLDNNIPLKISNQAVVKSIFERYNITKDQSQAESLRTIKNK